LALITSKKTIGVPLIRGTPRISAGPRGDRKFYFRKHCSREYTRAVPPCLAASAAAAARHRLTPKNAEKKDCSEHAGKVCKEEGPWKA
jgi:hypothetical protein